MQLATTAANQEEEEVIMYASFPDFKDPRFLRDKILNINDKYLTAPAITINGYEFKGQHERSLGSLLFMKMDDPDEPLQLVHKKTSFKLLRIPVVNSDDKPSEGT